MNAARSLSPSGRAASCLAACLAACIAGGGAVRAGEPFPFLIPGLDAAPGATDMSSLSARPAGAGGPVSVRDGHLVDGAGRRLRLLGVNLSFGANFPDHAVAEKVAAHLAKLGVNAVRHHHMDARDIWRRKADGTRELDPEKLERLTYFISRLKRHGIYSDVNLHVSRSVTEAEGFPDAAKLPRYNKYVLYLDARLQRLLKDYARTLLTWENPLTGTRLAAETSVATVEITNEDRFALAGHQQVFALPPRYQEEFRKKWNLWLRRKYGSTEALRKAWNEKSEPLGDDISSFGDPSASAAPWSLSARAGNRARLAARRPGPRDGTSALRVEIEKANGVLHELELACGKLTVQKGKLYTVSFWIRSEGERSVFFDVSRDGPDWTPVGIRETLKVSPDWRHVVAPFRAAATLRGRARWIFKLGDSDRDVWLADLHLRRGGEIVSLAGGALEKGTVEIPRRSLQGAVARDIRAFMEDTERAFFADMRRFLKEEIGVKAPVTGSQARWQSLSAFAPLDLVDAHAYWQHPRFPRRSWDARDWNIPNTPMIREPGRDALTRLAWYRVWGKPYTVSEYNHPAPNDYQVECVPLLCALAALQDWDGVYIYSYQHGAGAWEGDRIHSFFDINGNPAKIALLAAGAAMFRRADVAPARERITAGEADGMTQGLAIEHRVGATLASEAAIGALARSGKKRLRSDTGQVRWEAEDPARARFLVDSPRSKMALGFIANDDIRLGKVRLETGAVTRNFGVVAVTSLDGEPIAGSRRLLVTTLACAENTGMVFNADRTSVSDRWGASPPVVQIVPVKVSLAGGASSGGGPWRAFALDPAGARRGEVPVSRSGSTWTLRARPDDRTAWYEVVRD